MAQYKEITVRGQQSIEDVALQHYGSVEGLYQLLLDNRNVLTKGMDTRLWAGMTLRINTAAPSNPEMLAAINRIGLVPVSDPLTGVKPIEGPDYNDDYNEDYN